MPPISSRHLITFLTAAFVGMAALGAQSGDASDPLGQMMPTRRASDFDPESVVFQMTPDFVLWDAATKIFPRLPGLPYQIERTEGNRLLLVVPGQGLRGWASSASVVPLKHAEWFFSNSLKINARNPFTYRMRAAARRESGDLDRAIADLDEAVRLDPKYVAAWIERASLWRASNQPDRARADVNQAIQIDPSNAEAFVERGIVEFSQKDYSRCRKDLDRAIELDSHAVIIDIMRGMMELEKRNTKKAYEAFAHALHVDPKRHDAYLGLASVHLIRGHFREAEAVLDGAVLTDPQNPEAYGNRAMLYLNRGQYEQALFNLNEVIRLAPTSARAHRERAWLLATCPVARFRDGRQAVGSATRACELTNWKEPRYLAALAAAYSESGDFAAAIQCQERAIALVSANDPVRARFARVLARYRSSKPYHTLSLLEEMGWKAHELARPTGERTPG